MSVCMYVYIYLVARRGTAQARHHASGGAPPQNLLQTVEQGPHFFVRKLQSFNAGPKEGVASQ